MRAELRVGGPDTGQCRIGVDRDPGVTGARARASEDESGAVPAEVRMRAVGPRAAQEGAS